MPIKVLAPGLAALLSLRARPGIRSSAHTLARLIDPFAGDSSRVVSPANLADRKASGWARGVLMNRRNLADECACRAIRMQATHRNLQLALHVHAIALADLPD